MMTERERILVEALRDIANRAGAPTANHFRSTLDGSIIELKEQRESLNWIASRAAQALRSIAQKLRDAHNGDIQHLFDLLGNIINRMEMRKIIDIHPVDWMLLAEHSLISEMILVHRSGKPPLKDGVALMELDGVLYRQTTSAPLSPEGKAWLENNPL